MRSCKKETFLILLLFITAFNLYAQEKLKGNKVVITEDRDIYGFTKIEVRDNIDIILNQGTNVSVTVETDENLQEAIVTNVIDNTLIVELSAKIIRKKTLKVYITVNDLFDEIITKNRSNITGEGSFNLNSFTINAEGNSKISMHIKSTHFYLNNNESANLNLTINTEEAYLRANKTGRSKINITSNSIEVNGLGNSTTELIGNCIELQASGENKSNIKAATLESDEVIVSASDNTDIHVNGRNTMVISAINASAVYIYNSPAITVEKFTDKAILRKK